MGTDYRIRATAANGLVRAVAVQATGTVHQAQQVHRAWPVAAAAMGRVMICAAMLGSDMEHSDGRMTIEVDGNGPIGRIVVEIQASGALRARVQNPQVDLPLNAAGKLAVGQAVGHEGYFRVLRQDKSGEWYQSQVALQTGEIGEDFLHYLVQSEQIASAVSVGVLVHPDQTVIGAGGLMVQALPGCPTEMIESVSHQFQQLHQISRRLADGELLESFISEVLPKPLHQYPRESLTWYCGCQRMALAQVLGSLPYSDLDDLIADGGAEVICQFCQTAYRFNVNELQALRAGKH